VGAAVAGGPTDVEPGALVSCTETGAGAVLFSAAVIPTPRTNAARTPMSSGAAPKRRATGSTSRQRGQNPEMGVVV